jgi:heat shock protein HtpX
MVLAAVATPLLLVAALAGLVILLPLKILGGVAVAVALGTVIAVRERRAAPRGRALATNEAPELYAMVERLCVIGDLPRPDIVLEREAQPNSWIVDAPGRRPRLHVTEGLLDLLEPDELQAVLAHELSHVANHDAAVMTVVGLPGVVLLEGSRRALRGWGPVIAGAAIAGGVGLLSRIPTNALSRYREFSADAGACALTGRPATLACALLKVSGQLERVPRADLRAAAGRDAFHLLAVEAGPGKGRLARLAPVRRLAETHPSLERRVAALERLERRHRQARPALPVE